MKKYIPALVLLLLAVVFPIRGNATCDATCRVTDSFSTLLGTATVVWTRNQRHTCDTCDPETLSTDNSYTPTASEHDLANKGKIPHWKLYTKGGNHWGFLGGVLKSSSTGSGFGLANSCKARLDVCFGNGHTDDPCANISNIIECDNLPTAANQNACSFSDVVTRCRAGCFGVDGNGSGQGFCD